MECADHLQDTCGTSREREELLKQISIYHSLASTCSFYLDANMLLFRRIQKGGFGTAGWGLEHCKLASHVCFELAEMWNKADQLTLSFIYTGKP